MFVDPLFLVLEDLQVSETVLHFSSVTSFYEWFQSLVEFQ
jgi:hypothetical protein